MQIFSLGDWMPFERTFSRINKEERERILCNPQEHNEKQPILCPDEMYNEIRSCWNPVPDQRRSALFWHKYLCNYLEKHFKPVKFSKIVLFNKYIYLEIL